ncbi:MAG: DUF642 domain-containing protein [Deltaproteobacteria bacterium]|nr:DUF642 domain-containing protein [Deltaproteobacteria bacterium]MCB9487600.1 DUF642 domain-containing protein [Deltaproteobacteria bacterium]
MTNFAETRGFFFGLGVMLVGLLAAAIACESGDDDDDETQGGTQQAATCTVDLNEDGNLVSNSSFETPQLDRPFLALAADATIDEWTVTDKGVDLVGTLLQAGHGTQSVDLNNLDLGGVSQTLATEAGEAYVLKFCYAGNADGGLGVKEFEIFWGDESLGTWEFDTTGKTQEDMGWLTEEVEIDGDLTVGDETDLRFVSLAPDDSYYGPEIDAVVVVPAE